MQNHLFVPTGHQHQALAFPGADRHPAGPGRGRTHPHRQRDLRLPSTTLPGRPHPGTHADQPTPHQLQDRPTGLQPSGLPGQPPKLISHSHPRMALIHIQLEGMYSRAAEIFGGFWSQTPPLSLTQNVTAYQFLGPYNIV